MKNWILPVVAALFVSGSQAQDIAAMKGKKFPAFTMTKLDGSKIDSKNLKGKVYIIDFWATWCGPCKMMGETLSSVQSKFASKGLTVIGASAFERRPEALTLAEMRHKHPYTITKDNDKLAEKVFADGLPSVFVVDKKGVIRVVLTGWNQQLEGYISDVVSKLLKEK